MQVWEWELAWGWARVWSAVLARDDCTNAIAYTTVLLRTAVDDHAYTTLLYNPHRAHPRRSGRSGTAVDELLGLIV